MKIEEIKTIVKLMAENDLTEFKIEAEEMHLCIRRGNQAQSSGMIPQIVHQAPMVQQVAAPAPVAAAPAAAEAPKSSVNKITIDSPIVGTFYKASSPEASAFVKIGDKVTPETVVCIIEAMKVMNEIKAEKSGVIKEILLDNGTPVEFGQPLFVLE